MYGSRAAAFLSSLWMCVRVLCPCVDYVIFAVDVHKNTPIIMPYNISNIEIVSSVLSVRFVWVRTKINQ